MRKIANNLLASIGAPIGVLELDMIWGYFLAIQIAKAEFCRVTDVREDNAICSVDRIG